MQQILSGEYHHHAIGFCELQPLISKSPGFRKFASPPILPGAARRLNADYRQLKGYVPADCTDFVNPGVTFDLEFKGAKNNLAKALTHRQCAGF
jgi:hypothetical protein